MTAEKSGRSRIAAGQPKALPEADKPSYEQLISVVTQQIGVLSDLLEALEERLENPRSPDARPRKKSMGSQERAALELSALDGVRTLIARELTRELVIPEDETRLKDLVRFARVSRRARLGEFCRDLVSLHRRLGAMRARHGLIARQ